MFGNEGSSREEVAVYSWGRGDYGQLGHGDTKTYKAAAEGQQPLAPTASGSGFLIGMSGDEESEVLPCATPTRVLRLQGQQVVHTSGAVFHSCWVNLEGEVYVCGLNNSGQLGCQGRKSLAAPLHLQALDAHKVVSVACGQQHTIAVTSQGQLAAWGAAEFGQLGLGEDIGVDLLHPRLLKVPKDVKFASVACGACHTLALSRGGQVYAFGQGTFGALGLGSEVTEAFFPRPVTALALRGVVQVACGDHHSCCLDIEGQVWCWGRGKYGQLGLGDTKTRDNPTRLPEFQQGDRHPVKEVVCGGDFSLCRNSAGDLFAWGCNRNGQIGNGLTADQLQPCRVLGVLSNIKCRQVSSGSRHSIALGDDGRLYGWGCNQYGQLGLKEYHDHLEPTMIRSVPEMAVLFLVAAGDHTLVVFLERARHEGLSDDEILSRLEIFGAARRALQLPSILVEAEECRRLAQRTEDTAAALPSNSPHLQHLIRSVEAVFSSAGFLIHGFSTPSGLSRYSTQEGPGLDIQTIEAVYKALLGTYSTDLLTVLARSGASLAEGLRQQQLPVTGSPPAAGDSTAVPPPPQTGSTAAATHHSDPNQTAASSSASAQNQGAEAEGGGGGGIEGENVAGGDLWRRRVQCCLITLQSPLAGEPSHAATLLPPLHRLILHLPVSEQKALVDCLMYYPSDIFGARFVRATQKFISHRVSHLSIGAADELTVNAAKVLALMHTANEKAKLVNYSEFYNADLSKHLHLKDEYLRWAHLPPDAPATRFVSFCQLPFLLTPETKTIILQGEANLQKHHTLLMSSHLHDPQEFLNLRIRREYIRTDALDQIVRRPQDLKKPLRVKFVSEGVEEEAVDEGGVTKEFFQLLVRELFLTEFGMFTYDAETRTHWFSKSAMEVDPHQAELEFQLVGVVLGLAIYNQVLLDIHFPAVVYKKLKYLEVDFKDLEDAMPTTARSLKLLLEYTGDVQADICRTFEIEYECLGEVKTHSLVPNGADTWVTNSNRELFVELYTRWLLEEAVHRQFQAFASGFLQVCGGPALSLFRYEEVELLVCGLPHLDFEQLQKVAKYDGGYSPTHPTILKFWEVVHGFELEQKKRFLFFTTGCDRAPVGGLQTLHLLIQRSGPDCDRLPSAHTCFNTLLLPEYGSRGKMRNHLLIAIENSEGFGLQ